MMKKNLISDEEQEIAACMIDLGNGKFVRSLSGDQKFRSVIVSVDEQRGIALGLCPAFVMLPWSFLVLEVNTMDITSGREATKILLEHAAKKSVELPVAEFCYNYKGFGVEKGSAFLPSRFELNSVAAHERGLKTVMRMIGRDNLGCTLWSSSVNSDCQVWMRDTTGRAVSGWFSQMRTFGVMPMIEIKI